MAIELAAGDTIAYPDAAEVLGTSRGGDGDVLLWLHDGEPGDNPARYDESALLRVVPADQ